MHRAVAHLQSVSPYSQSRFHDTPKLDNGKENDLDYAERTWREHCHIKNGMVYIPPTVFKKSVEEAATFISMKTKGNATYAKHFLAGIMVPEEIPLPIKKEDLEHEWLFLNSDGKRGGGKRVKRCYPLIRSWEAKVLFLILDDIITKDVFHKHIEAAGQFIGIGRFRPRNGGYYGRFDVTGLDWD